LSDAHDVIAIDLPGHGASDKRLAGASLSDQARFVARFLETIGIERAHVVGHSMGGGIALALALICPSKVASLTLLAPAGLGPEINVDYLNDFIAAERRKDVEAVLGRLFAQRHFVSRALAEELTKYKRQDGVRAALEQLREGFVREARQAESFRSRLPEIGVPMVILWGLDDRIIPASHADDMPAAVVVEKVEGVGHMPHVEAADTVARRIRAVLGS
jgi:pyruvate dehydrogenase E2 component (dihydrolipoamide acetyltransferase)